MTQTLERHAEKMRIDTGSPEERVKQVIYRRFGERYAYPEYRSDGWPLCPSCGEDELYSLEIPATAETICGCYNCEFRPELEDQMTASEPIGGPILCPHCGEAYNFNNAHLCRQFIPTAADHLKHRTGSGGMEMKDELQKLKYEDSTQAEARAAEQWAVAYVAQVGATKETMIDALSTLRAVVMAYDRKLQNIPSTDFFGGDQIPEDLDGELAELKTKLLDIANNCDWFDSPCARQIRTVLESSRIKTLIERIAKAEAALAQKTRECEELRRCESPDPLECDNTNNHPHACHCNDPAYWKQKSDSLQAQVEQLQRQVAELSAGKKALWFNGWRPIIDAIGEISVQEAMDAIERDL